MPDVHFAELSGNKEERKKQRLFLIPQNRFAYLNAGRFI